MSGMNRENAGEAPGPIDRALDRDRDDKADILEGGADRTTARGATGRTAGMSDRGMSDRGEIRVPVAEERLDVEKREVETGEVRLRKTVTEEQVSVPVDLEREEVHVSERDVADRPAQAGDDLFQEGTIRVPIRGEEAMVTKEAVVTGEVVLDKERTTERQNITDTVRKERVEIDEDYQRNRGDFQQHFSQRQSQGGQHANRSWEEAEPNYQYGHGAAFDQRHQGREFDDVEPELRRDYETRRGGSASGTTSGMSGGTSGGGDSWQHLREEIREGWNRARNR